MDSRDKIQKLRDLAADRGATPAEAKLAREKADALAKANPGIKRKRTPPPKHPSLRRTSFAWMNEEEYLAKAKANRERLAKRAERIKRQREQREAAKMAQKTETSP
jgi:hypothetical protein